MRAFKQILKEFWIQTLLSIGWGIYKVSISTDDKFSVFITNFSAAIFLLSWMMGQIVRIKKQQKIEDEFNSLKVEIDLLRKDNVKLTHQLTNNVLESSKLILGDGKLIIKIFQFSAEEYKFIVESISNYPIYDTNVYIYDFDKIKNCKHTLSKGKLVIDRECFNQSLVTQMGLNNYQSKTNKYSVQTFKFDTKIRHFYVKIISRHAIHAYQYIFKLEPNGSVNYSYRLYERNNGKVEFTEEDGDIQFENEYWNEKFLNSDVDFETALLP